MLSEQEHKQYKFEKELGKPTEKILAAIWCQKNVANFQEVRQNDTVEAINEQIHKYYIKNHNFKEMLKSQEAVEQMLLTEKDEPIKNLEKKVA